VVTRNLTDYRFDEAANHLYRFVWHEFCDWYIELAKPRLGPDAPEHEAAATRATIVSTLETTLRLMHPFMPFITEEIWQKVPHLGDTIVLASYPQTTAISVEDQADVELMNEIITVVTAIRTMRSELNVPPPQKLHAGLITTVPMADLLRRRGADDVMRLARLSAFELGPDVTKPDSAVSSPIAIGEVFVVPAGIDLDKERMRLTKSLSDIQSEISRLDNKLKNPQFHAKAPRDVVADHEGRLSDLREQHLVLSSQLAKLGANGPT
jgi:valyl-tRNA synthetase